MKKAFALTGLAALMVVAPASAQSAKVSGLVQVWYNQVLDGNLRTNSTSVSPNKYYNLRSEFQENGFSIRRTELKVSGKIIDEIDYEVMVDPSKSSDILQDAAIKYELPFGLSAKVGQFKNLQTYEGYKSSSELLTVERSQMGRVFGDDRQRGGVLSMKLGDEKDLAAAIHLGVFNGSGRANDTNAQKDVVARVDFSYEKLHKFGFYTLQGSTDLADKGNSATTTLFAGTWTGPSAPTTAEVVDNKDKTTNYGVYYVFENDAWHASAEAITGLLGRRNPSLFNSASAAAKREHLDQKFFGFVVTGAYTLGQHTFLARYDFMNYNQGDKWYTATNPYKTATADYTPKYTEVTLGYLYAWKPEKVKAANFKLNYIMRSDNFLKPYGTQTGEQGGNNLVAAFQVAF